MTTKRKFTPEERLSILQEGEREGQASTIRKYQIAPSLYARWKHSHLISNPQRKYRRFCQECRIVRTLALLLTNPEIFI